MCCYYALYRSGAHDAQARCFVNETLVVRGAQVRTARSNEGLCEAEKHKRHAKFLSTKPRIIQGVSFENAWLYSSQALLPKLTFLRWTDAYYQGALDYAGTQGFAPVGTKASNLVAGTHLLKVGSS